MALKSPRSTAPDALFLEVERDPEYTVREFEHLTGHRALDAVHARNPVTNRDNAAHFGDVHLDGESADLIADDLGNLFGSYVHIRSISGCPTTSGGRSTLLFESFPDPCELIRDAAVVDDRPNPGHCTANERRIHRGRHQHPSACCLR